MVGKYREGDDGDIPFAFSCLLVYGETYRTKTPRLNRRRDS